MTLAEMLAAAYDDCGYQSSPATGVTTRITRYINEGIRMILAEPGLERLVDSDTPYSFASVASQARYVLPEPIARIQHISERTNDRTLSAMTLGQYRRLGPDPVSASGTPVAYVPLGRTAVSVQPSASSQLLVKSTSASDVFAIFIETIEADGTIKNTTLSMTGVTAANLGTATTVTVLDFYFSRAAVGTITLHQGTGTGPELARIGIGHTRPLHYSGLYLWPTPAAVVTYLVDYRRDVFDLVNTTDEADLPLDIHPAVVAYAIMREWEQKSDSDRLIMAKARFDKALSRLKYATQTLSDELPVSGRGRLRGHSRLGGWFPADTWT